MQLHETEQSNMNIIDQLVKQLENTKPNILGNCYAKIEIEGVCYSASATMAGSHQSANCWGRTDYKKNGIKIAKANLL